MYQRDPSTAPETLVPSSYFSRQFSGISLTGSDPLTTDRYGCLTIDTDRFTFPHLADADLAHLLDRSLDDWIGSGVRAIWCRVGTGNARWIPILAARGFEFHHAKPPCPISSSDGYVMMTRSFVGGDLPGYAFTTVGAAAIVEHPDDVSMTDVGAVRLLVIQERTMARRWKFPGGLAEPGEELSAATARELQEETGICGQFVGLLTFRHSHTYLFGCSDLYFVSVMKTTQTLIESAPDEIAKAEWLQIGKLLEMSTTVGKEQDRSVHSISPSVRFLIQSYVEYRKSSALSTGVSLTPPVGPALFKARPIMAYDGKNDQAWYINDSTNGSKSSRDL